MRELFANLIAEAKRLPWWAWLLIAAAAYLGFRLVTGGSSSQDSSSDPLAGVLEGGPSSSGDSTSSDGALPTLSGDPLPNFSGDPFDDSTNTGDAGVRGLERLTRANTHGDPVERLTRSASPDTQASRSAQQGADIRAAEQRARRRTLAPARGGHSRLQPGAARAQAQGGAHRRATAAPGGGRRRRRA
jgi:hypothetical protein